MRSQSSDMRWCLQESLWRTREAILVPTPSSGRQVCNPDVVPLREAVTPLQPLTISCTGTESCCFITLSGSPISHPEGTLAVPHWLHSLLSISVGGRRYSHRDSKTILPGHVPYQDLQDFCVLNPTFNEYGNGGPEKLTNLFKITQQERKRQNLNIHMQVSRIGL